MNARKKLIGTIAVAAAVLVPVAQAERPDDRAGLRGPGAFASTQSQVNHPDDRALKGPGAIEQLRQSTTVRPDDRAGMRGPGAIDPGTNSTSTSTRPDDRAEARGPGAIDPVVVVTQDSTGFDWDDAFVGALGGMGMALLLTGALFLLLGQRTRTRVA
jgi:hypothetical protein